MAGSTTTAQSGLLKNIYDTHQEKMQNLEHRTVDEFAKSLKKYDVGGKGFFGAINDYGNESGGAINESEQFRTIDSENYDQWKVLPKLLVWPIEFTGLLADVAETNEQAFAEAVVDAMDMAKERLQADENRQFFGYGTGELGRPAGNVTSGAVSFSVNRIQGLRKNMVVDVFNGATKTLDSRRISDIDIPNKVIYFATSLSAELITTDVIVKENIRDSAPGDGKEAMGLRGIVDDGTDVQTFQTLDSATNRIWRSLRIDASSANLTSDLLQRLIDDTKAFGGSKVDTLITHDKQRRKYLNLVTPQKRFQDGKMDAGFTELSFNGMRMLLDKDCQADTVYALTKAMIRKFSLRDLHIGGYGGSDKYQRIANYDVFQAYWRKVVNYGTSKRNAHGKIVSLATGSGIE